MNTIATASLDALNGIIKRMTVNQLRQQVSNRWMVYVTVSVSREEDYTIEMTATKFFQASSDWYEYRATLDRGQKRLIVDRDGDIQVTRIEVK